MVALARMLRLSIIGKFAKKKQKKIGQLIELDT